MLERIEKYIEPFRKCFSRERAFRWFAVILLSFMIRVDHLGVTSAIRCLLLSPGCYETMIHFFYSKAYELENIRNTWYRMLMDSGKILKINGRNLITGDGVKVSKEAFYMPGVQKYHQESDNSGKGSYIHGHLFGAAGIVAGTKENHFSIPLHLSIQSGLNEMAGWEGSGICGESHVVQMVRDCGRIAGTTGSSYCILDRYFLTVPALKEMKRLNDGMDADHRIDMVTKAKMNCIAYKEPDAVSEKGRGRPRLKGESVKVSALFEKKELFHESKIILYGEEADVKIMSIDLLWGAKLYTKLRFVLIEYNGMKSILAGTDMTLSAEEMAEIYSIRFSCENFFREYKQQTGGFGYHFWTKCIGKLNHFKKKDEKSNLHDVRPEDRKKVVNKVRAIECFVTIAAIAHGIIQLIAITEEKDGEIQKSRYLRTKPRRKVSEATVQYYLRQTFLCSLLKNPDSFITRYIRELQNDENEAKKAKTA